MNEAQLLGVFILAGMAAIYSLIALIFPAPSPSQTVMDQLLLNEKFRKSAAQLLNDANAQLAKYREYVGAK